MAIPLSGVAAQEAGAAGSFREAALRPGETGTAWFEEDFGGLFAVESVVVRPPDTVFSGRAQRLQVKLRRADGSWVVVLDLPVDPASARNPGTWPRTSLAPEIPPEREWAYAMVREAMRRQGREEPPDAGFYLEAEWAPAEPVLVRGIRVELTGPYAPGKGWTFLVRTDSSLLDFGGVAHEWSYHHVW